MLKIAFKCIVTYAQLPVSDSSSAWRASTRAYRRGMPALPPMLDPLDGLLGVGDAALVELQGGPHDACTHSREGLDFQSEVGSTLQICDTELGPAGQLTVENLLLRAEDLGDVADVEHVARLGHPADTLEKAHMCMACARSNGMSPHSLLIAHCPTL